MDIDRLHHSYSVATLMMDIAKKQGLSNEEIETCYLIGLNHDIGYEFCIDKECHNVVGGNILKNTGFEYWREVYYHGDVDSPYTSKYLDILNRADMQVDSKGNIVGYDSRLEDISSRYGIESDIYKKCYILVEKLKLQEE